VVFFGTIAKRKGLAIYVANWFFGAFIITVALLQHRQQHGDAGEPDKSYSAYPGAIDAMVQWCTAQTRWASS